MPKRRTGACGAVLALTVVVGLPAVSAGSAPQVPTGTSVTQAEPSATTPVSPSLVLLAGLATEPPGGPAAPGPCAEVAASADDPARPGSPDGSAAPSDAPFESPSAPTIMPRVIPMADAWGDVPVQSIATDLGDDRRFSFAGAATSDGEWLIGASVPKAFDVEGKVTWGRSDAVLVRVSDGAVHPMAKLTTPVSQMLFAASDGPWVVWMEADDSPYFYDWRLRLYDQDTGKVRELAHARHKGDGVLEGPWPVPWVSDDIALWGQAIGPLAGDDALRNAVVREADLRTGDVTTLADHAGLPVISGPWMAWGMQSGTDSYTLATNRETGQQERLELQFHTLALHGASAAYNTMDYHVVCMIDDLGTGATARPIVADPNTTYEWITINDRAVGFAQQSLIGEPGHEPTQVYDRRLDALVDLPMVVGFSQTFAVGPLVVWRTPTERWDDPPDFIRVVDIRDIGE